MTWRSKKQPIVARSSIEVDFQALTQGKYEIMWIKILLKELHMEPKVPMKVYCDNKATINIAHNLVQHNRTKHVEVDRHFIKEKIESGKISTPFVTTKQQLGEIVTKGIPSITFDYIVGSWECMISMP